MRKSSMVNMHDLVYRAKHQKDDLPAPKVKLDFRSTKKTRKPIQSYQNYDNNLGMDDNDTSSQVVEYDDASLSPSTEFSEFHMLPPDLQKIQLSKQADRQKNIHLLRHEERKIVGQVNRPDNAHVIKNSNAYVKQKGKAIGNLFRQELALVKLDGRKDKGKHGVGRSGNQKAGGPLAGSKSAKVYNSLFHKQAHSAGSSVAGGNVSGTTSAAATNMIALPNAVLSEQTLEDDIKRNKKQLEYYRKMVDPAKIKKFNKAPAKMPRLTLWKYLYQWDVSSSGRRDGIIIKFIEHYVSIDPLDMDGTLNRGGSLIFTRFVIAMQLAYERRKTIWHYFQALGLFLKSLQGERFVYEFGLMGGFATAFGSLKIDEMKIRDKANVFYFLYRTIDGVGGTRVKNFICRESTYLDSVVDCLTMCDNIGVIHFAQLFLENMCIGTKMENLSIVSNYIISLLPCDFNPRVQIMACQILALAVHQKDEIAAHCYEYVVDVLKTDYDPILVACGELCIAIMSTPIADHLLLRLIEVSQPSNLTEDLAAIVEAEASGPVEETDKEFMAASGIELPEMMEMVQQEASDEFDEEKESEMSLILDVPTEGGKSFFERPPPENSTVQELGGAAGAAVIARAGRAAAALNVDMFYRQQLGSIFVLGFMLKNRIDFAEWMLQKGIVGSLLTAIGSSSYQQVQLMAVRLLLLIHDLTPECVAALGYLLPKKLVAIILDKGEGCLEYITAVHCTVLRQLGRLVQKYWEPWFTRVVLPPYRTSIVQTAAKSTSITALPDTVEAVPETDPEAITDEEEPTRKSRLSSGFNERPIESILLEIRDYTQTLEFLFGDSLQNVIETMDLIGPDAEFFGPSYETSKHETAFMSTRLVGKTSDQLTVGENEILTNENLEPFRKYLNKGELTERADEFEKYYAAQFGSDSEYEMGGMEMAALQEAEKALGRLKEGTSEYEDLEELGEVDVGGSPDLSSSQSLAQENLGPGEAPVENEESKGMINL